ncbi:MAG: hypothetical protein GX575_04875 [Candidatus Anammoximicrobium sp.]|nr:hypothetical protein [Candidatus Anammoximicrobium sp.]
MTTKAKISAGICGFATTVTVSGDVSDCAMSLESDCPAVQQLALELSQLDPLREVLRRDASAAVWELAVRHCLHAACPVPVGILKAVEVEAGLALPADVTIEIRQEPGEGGG